MIQTARLLLRRLDYRDAPEVFRLRSDAGTMRYIRKPETDPTESDRWIDLVSSRWEKEEIGFCAVIEKSSGQFAGWCGLWRLSETLEVEVGYALLPEFRGKGYASEAAEAFLAYGFIELGLDKIVAVANPENAASRGVMTRLGMSYDGIGKFYGADLVHYTLTRETWSASRGEVQQLL